MPGADHVGPAATCAVAHTMVTRRDHDRPSGGGGIDQLEHDVVGFHSRGREPYVHCRSDRPVGDPVDVGAVEHDVDLDPDVSRESRLKTISGDVEVGLLTSSCVCEYHTASGDLECDEPARIIREGRKDRTVIIGDGRSHLTVKTVSGDLTIKPASSSVREEPAAAEAASGAEAEAESEGDRDPERTAPMAPPATARVRDLLERLARGEVSVDEVAEKLDETRRYR